MSALATTGRDLVAALGDLAARRADTAARDRANAAARTLDPAGRTVVRVLRRGAGRYTVFASRDPDGAP
jgi:hypothetical protein